jgi:hypothetical protein
MPARRKTPPSPTTLRGPVVILAGGADREGGASRAEAGRVLPEAFSRFRGTLISGGTESGVAGIAGAIAAARRAVEAVGYLPRRLPAGVRRDRRYARFRTTPSARFSAAEPLQYWADLLAAGIDPASVTLVGWGGGAIAAAEYRLALALGARVGLVAGSGRSADALLGDPLWRAFPNLRALPPRPARLRAFLASR